MMRVRMVKMFNLGVEVERRMLLDCSTRHYGGELVIMDATDQGRHRPVKVARLMSERALSVSFWMGTSSGRTGSHYLHGRRARIERRGHASASGLNCLQPTRMWLHRVVGRLTSTSNTCLS
jgi:hypothetical protein